MVELAVRFIHGGSMPDGVGLPLASGSQRFIDRFSSCYEDQTAEIEC